MGFLSGLRERIGGFDPSRLAVAGAFANGDPTSAFSIMAQQRQRTEAQRRAEQEAERAREAEARRAEAAQALGISKEQLNAMRPEEISRILESRFESRQFGPEGGSVRNVGPDGQATYDQAPWQRQVGRGIIAGGPNGAPAQPIYQGVEPVSVQPGGGVAGVRGGEASWLVPPAGVDAPPLQADPSSMPRPRSQAERDALPPGTRYIAPDGSVRTVGGAGGGGAQRPFGASFNPVPEIQSQFGVQPTSGFRTPGHQADLVRQGLTQTQGGSHPRGDALDLPTPPGMTKQQFIAAIERQYPGARAIPSNGNSIHVTFPGWGRAPDVSGSRRRYPSRGR